MYIISISLISLTPHKEQHTNAMGLGRMEVMIIFYDNVNILTKYLTADKIAKKFSKLVIYNLYFGQENVLECVQTSDHGRSRKLYFSLQI